MVQHRISRISRLHRIILTLAGVGVLGFLAMPASADDSVLLPKTGARSYDTPSDSIVLEAPSSSRDQMGRDGKSSLVDDALPFKDMRPHYYKVEPLSESAMAPYPTLESDAVLTMAPAEAPAPVPAALSGATPLPASAPTGDAASDDDIGSTGDARHISQDRFGDRDINMYVPETLPPVGQRAMVVVLHGGMGNANFMEHHLGMDAVAEKYGFVVAYLNGTRAAMLFPARSRAWNAGGECCGQPAKNNINDVAYITAAVKYLTQKYGINPARVYGMGHSNGAMMTQLLMCTTNLYQAAVPVSGPLNAEVENCTAAQGKNILAIHGAADENVPVAGGKGTRGISGATYQSEEKTKQVFEASGASYTLQLVPAQDHALDHLDKAIQQSEGISIAEKAARFFGLVSLDIK